jgi:AraC-like DNA-binding protein
VAQSTLMLFVFPNFNQWSSPLLFLTLQGVIFALLLFTRYYKNKQVSDLLLGSLLTILCYHRITYIIGFMDWYDTFHNTKINYWLIAFEFSVGPLLYLYVKSVTTSGFKFVKAHIYHFIPQIIYVIYKLWLIGYDANQPGFSDTQNGIMMESIEMQYVNPFYVLFTNVQMILYLAFTVQMFIKYRAKIKQFYSNTFKLELNWLASFLAIYILLFIYSLLQMLINISIFEMSWTQKWWFHFVSCLAIIYIGVKGYFTKTNTLKDLEFNSVTTSATPQEHVRDHSYEKEIQKLTNYIHEEKPYLNPDMSLKLLADGINLSPSQVSEIINNGFGINFNDFINKYRVEEIKLALQKGDHKSLSLVAIAFDCGFNSKATFNRVFKKVSGMSPTEFLKTLNA